MQMSCGLLRRLGIGKMRSQWITATVAAAASFKLIYSLDIQFFRMNMQIGEELSVRAALLCFACCDCFGTWVVYKTDGDGLPHKARHLRPTHRYVDLFHYHRAGFSCYCCPC